MLSHKNRVKLYVDKIVHEHMRRFAWLVLMGLRETNLIIESKPKSFDNSNPAAIYDVK